MSLDPNVLLYPVLQLGLIHEQNTNVFNKQHSKPKGDYSTGNSYLKENYKVKKDKKSLHNNFGF